MSMLLLGSMSAFAISDEYSTGPGQGTSDQLDDLWQAIYNGWGLSPNGDEDHDGCSNLFESIAGGDPRNPGDCLMVGNMTIGGTNIIMNFDAKNGKEYQVWESNSPGGPPPSEPGSAWTQTSGASKVATADGPNSIVFPKPAGNRKFYRLESKDRDQDSDGVSDWAEKKLGSDINVASSPSNASGGAATDLETMRSLMTLQATAGTADAFEKEGTPATIRLQRSYGTMPLTVTLSGEPGSVQTTKGSADTSDFVFRNTGGVMTNTFTLPANQGISTPYEVARVSPTTDSEVEVPEALKVVVALPGAPEGLAGPEAMVNIKDANPANPANRTLYVAFLGREAGIVSTASGYATALVNGDNTSASVSIVFNNLSSEQNTAYIRIGTDLEVQVLPRGQVDGAGWDICAAQTALTDQAMLDALKSGQLYVAITTANYPEKEIYGYFNKATGSETFDETNDDLDAPDLGSALWQAPAGDALEREIWRFLSQATFGGTTALYNEVRAEVDAAIAGGGTYIQGLSNWLDKQIDPAQTPTLSYRQLVMAADTEEFMLRGNKPITYASDPQINGGTYGVSYVNGMPVANTSLNTNAPGDNYPRDAPNRRREWWTMVLQSKDQVRQRVTQALHEICVVSERDATLLTYGYGLANYWDMLAQGAFGKYRTLLEQVSLNPMMGVYLTSVANRAAYDAGGGLIISPDENYAREIMQLFSIGLVLRHPDGSLQLSSEGLPIATYDNNDITELARVFTGFSHGARHGNATAQVNGGYGSLTNSNQRISPTIYANGTANNTWFGRDNGHLYWQAPWTTPMKVIGRIGTTVYHDYNTYSYLDTTQDPPVQTPVPGVSKRLLAGKHGQYEIPVWSPTGQTDAATHAKAAEEVSKAHDCLAGVATASTYGAGTQGSPGHTNTPVNISRWLIQRLVTSNPSAGYIYRVQKVYRDANGTLGPVIKAILLDYEARSLQLADSSISHGKVKEPLIHFTNILRQFRAYSGASINVLRDMSPPFSDTDGPMTSGYSAAEVAKFSTENIAPPSKPVGWPDGPFRFRIDSLRGSLGQSPQDAPSVFNWFYPDFIVPGRMAQAGLFAPELQISTEAGEVSKINFLYAYTWMTLAGMSTTPGVGVANFILNNGSATPAVRFSTNGGGSFLNWPASIVLDSTNWNTGVTVTMVGVNNQQISQMAGSTVRYSVSGSAPGYANIATLPTPVTFVENEVPGEQLVISHTNGNTWVREGGSITDTFSIMLSSPPMSGTTVDVTLAPQNGEVTLSTSTLAPFDSSNWNVPQIVTVTAVDDGEAENAGTGNDLIAITTTSTAASWHNLSVPSLPVGVMDNDDSYGIIITQSGGSTDVSETGNNTAGQAGIDTYTIVLTKAPTANVIVTITSNGQLGINSSGTTFVTTNTTRTFTTANWNTPQTVVVRGNNDTTSEGPHIGTLTHTVATAGGYTSTLPIPQIVANITDDDNGIILDHTGGETRVAESGLTDTITVRLRSNPNAEVSVTLGSAQLRFSPSTLTFHPTGGTQPWSVDQVVTVSAVEDFYNEGLHTGSIIAYSQSAGTNFNGSSSGNNLPVAIIDNDDSRLLTIQSGGSTIVNEDGATDTYTLALTRAPKPGTTVTAALSGFSGITVTPPGPFVFNETNWNSAQIVTIGTANDGTAEPRATTNITHTLISTDPIYDRAHTPVVTVLADDNDPPLTVSQTNIFTQVKEGGSTGTGGTPNLQDTFTVVLPRAPAAGTTVTVTLNPGSQTTVNPSVLTFTSATSGTGAYNAAQTVTVSAVDDALPEAAVHTAPISFGIVSTDSYYNGISAPPVIVQVTDNDSPGISIVESSGTTSVTEGTGTDSYTVVLTQLPTGNVDVLVDGGTQARVNKTGTTAAQTVTLNFTTANWSTAQTVTVTAFNDTLTELRHRSPITHAITPASAPEYAALSVSPASLPAVTAIISDDAGDNTLAANRVRISESSGSTSTTESGATVNGTSSNSDTFTVVLSQQPTAPVTVTFVPDGQLTVSPTTLTFIPGATGTGTFNVAQTVTVRAVDDSILEPILHWGTITATTASTDPNFNGTPVASLISSIYDNDGPRVNVIPSEGSTVLTENGVTDTYSVSLSHQPAADVILTATANSQITLSTSSLTFTADNWNLPQTLTLTAVNDTDAEATSHPGLITHSVASADPLYNGIGAASVTTTIWDNDSPSLDIAHAGSDPTNTTIMEGGANDAIILRLNQAPPAGTSVTISLTPPAFLIPVAQHGKTSGYFVNDLGGSNERDNIVIDYTESILQYRTAFYTKLAAEYGGTIPNPFPTTPSAADNIKLQNAHWTATKTIVDKMDLWFSGGSLKARNPVLIEPNQPAPVPLPAFNPRQAIMDAVYRHSGGSASPATTRYAPQAAYNPQSPPTGTFDTDIRDRVRWAGYMMTVGAPSFVTH